MMDIEGWAVVAELSGPNNDFAANMVLALLQGCDIECVRLPVQAPTTAMGGMLHEPIRVFVPEEHEKAARAIIEEHQSPDAPDSSDADE